ncbi:MAG: DUF1189 family protein, partial [Patescibacteria group bacterium]
MIIEIMGKINNTFINSLIPNKKFYKGLLKKELTLSFNYFLGFIFLLNLLFFIILSLRLNLPSNYQNIKEFLNNLDEIPESLVINIDNSHLSTNQDRPLLLWLNNNGRQELIAVLDETASADKINQYGSPLLLTSSEIVIKQDVENYATLNYPNETIKITKDQLVNAKNMLFKSFPLMVSALIFYLLAISPFIIFLLSLIFLALLSLPIYFIFHYKSKKIKYDKVFQISLHASTI